MNTDYTHECSIAKDRAMFAAREEVRLFCEIFKSSYTDSFLVGDDPHGVVCIGDYFFDMSDIHTVIEEYQYLLKKYETHEAIDEVIEEWYCYSIDMHTNHKDEPCINLKSWLMGARPEILTKDASHD